MNKYAQAAVRAANYVKNGLDAEKAWEKASCEFYEKNSPSQKKSCPRLAFLGLFSKNQRTRNYTGAVYAQNALSILKSNPNREYSKKELWALVTGEPKAHNAQMDVVLALWNNRLVD